MAIKKGILCQDEAKTQPVYPYTQTDCVFDEDTNMPQENINQSLAGSLATIETSPSTSAHSVGEYIVYNYQLYKVISAISVNDSLVENTNIQKVNVIEASSGAWELKKTSTITGGTFSLYINKVQKLGAVKWQGNGTSLPAGLYTFVYGEIAQFFFTTLLPVYIGDATVTGYLEVAAQTTNLRTNNASTWSSCTVIAPLSTILY